MEALSAIFWGLVVLSLLVFVHEGGHYLAARAFSVRVTEFFLGMPSRFRISFRSKRLGTEYGVTPILLGGYNRISGMEGEEDELLAPALALVTKRGRMSVKELAQELSCEEARASQLLYTLASWASIEPVYDELDVSQTNSVSYSDVYQSCDRDEAFLTRYDRGNTVLDKLVYPKGSPQALSMSPDEFLEHERSHTYLGCGFIKRIIMLVAGPLVNIVLAFVLVTVSLMSLGFEYAVDTNVIGAVVEGSYAEAAGLSQGDTLTAINDTKLNSWTDIVSALDEVLVAGNEFDIYYEHLGQEKSAHVQISSQEQGDILLGISATTETYYPSFQEAAMAALSYAAQVAGFVVQLLMPNKTFEILGQSSSVVGISVMAADAAKEGLRSLALITGSISMSLGFMNLLPIPPLDGGKILIEIIQLILGRPLSLRAQNIVGYLGLAFFVFIFLFALSNDITRLAG